MPPYVQISLLVLFSAGNVPIITVGLPGAQGAVIAGTQGIGVSTPKAAAVAEATVGFDGQVHIPKGSIFTIGLLSIIFARGIEVMVLLFGRTFITDGAIPKEHISFAPPHTANPIIILCTVRVLFLSYILWGSLKIGTRGSLCPTIFS